MKKVLTIVAGVVLLNLSAFAQGSILLQNVGPGLNAGVKDKNGVLIPAGSSQFMVELLGAASGTPNAFSPIVTTTTWVGNGWFGVGQPEKVLPGLAPGSFPQLQVRVWDSTGGALTYAAAIAAGNQYGSSTIWQLAASSGGLGNPGASPAVPGPALIGMTGFQLQVPEPSTVALGLLGVAALLLRRRK